MAQGEPGQTVPDLVWETSGLQAIADHPPGTTIDPVELARAVTQYRTTHPEGGPGWVRHQSIELASLPEVPRRHPPEAEAPRPDLDPTGVLGLGGMGVVQLARQHSLGREVAVKVLRDDAPARALPALIHEARIAGFLEHPNILPVHALHRDDDGRPVIVMKRIEGVEWAALLAWPDHPAWGTSGLAEDPVPVRHLKILDRVCDALRFAHSRGIVHRDVKPDNVMIGAFGEVVLLDWGIAARVADLRARPGAVVGTPAYMAPEMLEGSADERTDVYLLGAVLHHLLTGAPRHRGRALRQVVDEVLLSEPWTFDEDVPHDLARLCNDACAPEPHQRPASVEAFQARLRDHLRHRGAFALMADGRRAMRDAAEARRDDRLAESAVSLQEARFAWRQALRVWPESDDVREGLANALYAGADLALARGHLAEAEALLDDLEEVSGKYVDRMQALRAEQARQRALHRLAQDLDPEGDGPSRTAFVAGTSLAMAGVAVAVHQSSTLGFGWAVWLAGMLAVLSLLGLALGGRRLFAHPGQRRVALFVVVGTVAVLINRILGDWRSVPLEDTLAQDLLLVATVAGAAAVSVDAWIVVVALAGVGAAVLAVVRPEWASALLTLAAVGISGLVALAWRRRRTRPGARDAGRLRG